MIRITYEKSAKKLIDETNAIIHLNQFLREEVGLKDRLSARGI
jgi:hypothetical protein